VEEVGTAATRSGATDAVHFIPVGTELSKLPQLPHLLVRLWPRILFVAVRAGLCLLALPTRLWVFRLPPLSHGPYRLLALLIRAKGEMLPVAEIQVVTLSLPRRDETAKADTKKDGGNTTVMGSTPQVAE